MSLMAVRDCLRLRANSLVYASSDNVIGEIFAGGENQVLQIVGGVPTWADVSGSNHNLLSTSHTDTSADTPLRGALITGQGGTPTWSRLAIGASGSYLTSNGVDINWATTSLGVAYGGTGTTTFNQYSLIYASLHNVIGEIMPGIDGQVLKMVSGRPQWGADITSSGSSGLWATTTDNLAIYPSTFSQVLIVGGQATTSPGLPVRSNRQYFDGQFNRVWQLKYYR